MPGMLDRLARWSGRFRRILVVTNQRGVGKGIMSLDDLNRIHDRMIEEIERHGGRIDRVYFCHGSLARRSEPQAADGHGAAGPHRLSRHRFRPLADDRRQRIGPAIRPQRRHGLSAGRRDRPPRIATDALRFPCSDRRGPPADRKRLSPSGNGRGRKPERTTRNMGPRSGKGYGGTNRHSTWGEPRKRNATASAGLRKPPEDRCRAPP